MKKIMSIGRNKRRLKFCVNRGKKIMSVPKYYGVHKPILECLSDGQAHTMKELKVYVIKYLRRMFQPYCSVVHKLI